MSVSSIYLGFTVAGAILAGLGCWRVSRLGLGPLGFSLLLLGTCCILSVACDAALYEIKP